MNAVYTHKAKQWSEGFHLLQIATTLLTEIIGPSGDIVTAEWDRTEDDNGRALYTLRICDPSGETKAKFPPEELNNRDYMRIRLYHLWGDILEKRSHKQLEALLNTGGTSGK